MAAPSGNLRFDDARDKLRSWRESNTRRSDEVIELWESILQAYVHKLGEEKFLVYEQVCIAALDCGRISIAQKCLQALNVAFPDSTRVKKLKGMRLEALDRYDEALFLYDEILKKDETNSIARKRKVAILKSQNKISDAIEDLNRYLKKFMGDYEAWMELADLYIRCQDYSKAAFCLEELIMSSPYNHLYHQRFAEVKYTHGGMDNMEMARSYFAQAVTLNPDNIRALHGIVLASSTIAASPKCNAKKKKEHQEYAEWAARQIAEKYQQQAASTSHKSTNKSSTAKANGVDTDDINQLKVVTDALSQLQLSTTT